MADTKRTQHVGATLAVAQRGSGRGRGQASPLPNGERPLPEGWVWTTLGEIRRDDSRSIDPRKHPGETFELYSVPSHATGQPELLLGRDIGSTKRSVEPETVLLCKINPRINRVWVSGDYSAHRKIASTEWIPFFKIPGLYPKFLSYFMQTDELRNYLTMNVSGVGGSLMRIRPSVVEEYPFPLPPLPEQQRIVAAIETQFTRLDAGVAALKRVQANLKRYKASVLKAACEGRLVPTEAALARGEGRDYEPADVLLDRILAERRAKWEEQEWAKLVEKAQKKTAQARRKAAGRPARVRDLDPSEWQDLPEAAYARYLPKNDAWKAEYKEPPAPDTSGLPDLPEGWVWGNAEQICDFITKGTTPKSNKLFSDNGDIPFIKVYNLTFNGVLDFTVNPTFVNIETHTGELARSRVLPEDVLMNIVGPPLGKVSVVPDTYDEWNMNQAIARFRPIPGYDKRFL